MFPVMEHMEGISEVGESSASVCDLGYGRQRAGGSG